MSKKRKERILRFKVVATNEPLVAKGGLILPSFARATKLPRVKEIYCLLTDFSLIKNLVAR